MAVLDFDIIVEQVREAGLAAYVEQTGGGCATIYAAKDDATLRRAIYDEEAAAEEMAACGPGWFNGPGWTEGRGTTGELYVGFADQGQSVPWPADDSDDERSVARRIVECVRREGQWRSC